MRTTREAFKEAKDSGVIDAWLKGKPVQYNGIMNQKSEAGWVLQVVDEANFGNPHLNWRIKPWQLTKHIPGFRALVEGEEWHRQDFTEEMLPEGYRPLLLNECEDNGGDYYLYEDSTWLPVNITYNGKAQPLWNHRRTKRPLPYLPKPKKRIPLGFDDIIAGSVLRSKTHTFTVTGSTHSGVSSVFGAWGFERLMNEGFEMQVSESLKWTPCWTEVEVTE